MQRYFLNDNTIIIDNKFKISGNDFHHIKNVMRMKPNDKVYCCIDSKTYLCKINSFFSDYVELSILEKIEKSAELKVDVTIAQGLVRREKMEEVIRRIVELGAHKYIPVIMERSIIKVKDSEKSNSKLERQKTIIKEACEQSHRDKLMEINDIMSFKELLTEKSKYDLCLYAYEESGRENNYNLMKYLKTISGDGKSILVIVGPEGGFSEKEVSLLENSGFKAVGLGPRILRTETAPLYIMSVIAYQIEMGENNES